MTKLIRQINFPADLRKFSRDKLKQISDELRDELIDVVSETGGHLGAGLGVVELTVALHYVFDTPKDKLVWDVSHQCYPHKIITGRKTLDDLMEDKKEDPVKIIQEAVGLIDPNFDHPWCWHGIGDQNLRAAKQLWNFN